MTIDLMEDGGVRQTDGKTRVLRLFRRLKRIYPDKDIRLTDESLVIDGYRLVKYKVAYHINGRQMCDAIWGWDSNGYNDGLLEFYCDGEPEGGITEIRAFNLFRQHMETDPGDGDE